MKKLSVIIPTLLANRNVLNKLLNILNKDEVVDEIILINNSKKVFKPRIQCDKLKIYAQKTNLYVNPSWNLGIELIKNDIFLIINDDILCPKNFCSAVVNSGILDKDDTGLVGLDNGYINNNDIDTKTLKIPQDIDVNTLSFSQFPIYLHTGNWGSAFFGRKENYYTIIPEFKVIFGDNYLLHKNLENGKINYRIFGARMEHIPSLSSSKGEVCDAVGEDIQYARKIGYQ